MLSASDDRVYAKGSGEEAGTPSTEEYWKWGNATRLAKDGRTIVSGPVATKVRGRGRASELRPGPLDWLGWTDRLLHPHQLYIWGRPGEDWRLGDIEGWSPDVNDAVVLTLESVEDRRVGVANVDPHSGRVLQLELPGHLSWRLDQVDENPDVAAWPIRRWFTDCVTPDWLSVRSP
jgi:hypothetical protein